MKIEKIKLTSLIPYSKNSKKHTEKQIQHIAKSIKEFGFLQPIVVDKNNNIVVGHGRFEALKLLKETEVDIIKVEDLTEDQVKAYRILDNKLNSDTSYDFESILEEFESLTSDGFLKEFEIYDWLKDQDLNFSSVEDLDAGDNENLESSNILKIEVEEKKLAKKIISEALESENLNFNWK